MKEEKSNKVRYFIIGIYVVFVAVQDNGICQIYSPKRIDSSTENRLRFSMSFPYVLEEGIEAVG